MSRFAPVCPIQVLEGLKEEDELGDYHLLLTHHILDHKQRFFDLFNTSEEEVMYNTPFDIIVDNSLVELKTAASDELVFEACQALPQQHTIIPVLMDVMGDGPATRDQSEESYNWWVENTNYANLMVVLQAGTGRTIVGDNDSYRQQVWEDFVSTTDHFLMGGFKEITWVGIPRILTHPNFLGTRERAIKYVQAIRPDIKIHLLGFSDNVADDIICSKMPNVEGIDSAVPLRCEYTFTPAEHVSARKPDWFDTAKVTPLMLHNLANVRKWVGQ